jgi:hypothetical protein
MGSMNYSASESKFFCDFQCGMQYVIQFAAATGQTKRTQQ